MSAQEQTFKTPVTILVVDPNKSYREITRKMLLFHDSSYVIDDTDSIQQSLKQVLRRDYDVILANHQLTDGDAFVLLQTLKTEKLDVPVLVFFEEGNEEEARSAIEAGAVDYIIKSRGYLTALPFTVNKALEKHAYKQKRETFEQVGAQDDPLVAKGYFILNQKGRFLSANPGMVAITGYSEDEITELSILDLIPKGGEWELFQWLQSVESGKEKTRFRTTLTGKFGTMTPVSLKLNPVRDSFDRLKSYRGEVEVIDGSIDDADDAEENFHDFIAQIWDVAEASRNDATPKLLGRLAQLSCQVFGFERATVAIFDRAKRAYVKVAMLGYSVPDESERRRLEVPSDVIDGIFARRHRTKILYYDQDSRTDMPRGLETLMPERRSQSRPESAKWHPRDVLLINLADNEMRSYGYFSLDTPIDDAVQDRRFFDRLEAFSALVSMVVENHARGLEQNRKSRRLTQALVTSNIFKLYLGMQDLLKEVVWSIKFSLDFNMVALMLISEKSGKAEVQTVACDDKIKTSQLQSFKLELRDFMNLLKPENQSGKSFYIEKAPRALQSFKQVYYMGKTFPPTRLEGEWPRDAMLFAPLKSRFGKVMGAIFIDDPADMAEPSKESVRTLEILATQVSVAIENRLMYVEAKRMANGRMNNNHTAPTPHRAPSNGPSFENKMYSRRSLWDKLFKE